MAMRSAPPSASSEYSTFSQVHRSLGSITTSGARWCKTCETFCLPRCPLTTRPPPPPRSNVARASPIRHRSTTRERGGRCSRAAGRSRSRASHGHSIRRGSRTRPGPSASHRCAGGSDRRRSGMARCGYRSTLRGHGLGPANAYLGWRRLSRTGRRVVVMVTTVRTLVPSEQAR
jgi:hypothetical protein